jgi:hypothetical protein
MPGTSINDPQHWRYRAEEIRTLAEDMNNEDARQIMLRKLTEERIRSSPHLSSMPRQAH